MRQVRPGQETPSVHVAEDRKPSREQGKPQVSVSMAHLVRKRVCAGVADDLFMAHPASYGSPGLGPRDYPAVAAL